MATYVIGDVQGCFDELQNILQYIDFNESEDKLWFVGDLVNRGTQSLQVLRFVKQLDNAIVVLGNHDLHLLALYYIKDPLLVEHNLHGVLTAPDCGELIEWLRMRPLLYHDKKLGYVMVHAGIYPQWDLAQAKKYAREVEKVLHDSDYIAMLEYMYGNEPNKWHDNLRGEERLRFIINSFVRMRFCTPNGQLDFISTAGMDDAPAGYLPWFKVPDRRNQDCKIVFGHWAALGGETDTSNVYALDTGCVWGGHLTAMRLEDGKIFK